MSKSFALLSVLMVLVLGIGMAACGGKNGSGENTRTAPQYCTSFEENGDACMACIQPCCEPCTGNSECIEYETCIRSCQSGNVDCWDECNDSNPTGADAYNDLIYCTDDCYSACFGD